MAKFYVYELVVIPDGNVCYVGKGCGYRMYMHHRIAKSGEKSRQSSLYKSLISLLSSGKDFEPRKVFETEIEAEALAEERRRIEHYGLTNLFNSTVKTGPSTAMVTARLREAMRRSRNEYVAKLQAEHGYKMPPEVARKIGQSNIGKVMPIESVQRAVAKRMSNAAHVEWLKQHCKHLTLANTGTKQTPEHIEKAAATRRGKKHSLERTVKQANGLRGKGARHNARSRCRGVTWFGRKKAWQSRISVLGKVKMLGQFKIELDAAWAYDNEFERLKGVRPNGTDPQHRVSRFKRGQRGRLVLREE